MAKWLGNLVGTIVLFFCCYFGVIVFSKYTASIESTNNPMAVRTFSPDSNPSESADSSSESVNPDATATPLSEPETYTGKVDDLPEPAQAVMNFTPADSPNETSSESIRDRVVDTCGFGDYVGSKDYPGSVTVSPPREHGWVRVVWTPGKCSGIGGSMYSNPVLKFEISEDRSHINYLDGEEGAAYCLSH